MPTGRLFFNTIMNIDKLSRLVQPIELLSLRITRDQNMVRVILYHTGIDKHRLQYIGKRDRESTEREKFFLFLTSSSDRRILIYLFRAIDH